LSVSSAEASAADVWLSATRSAVCCAEQLRLLRFGQRLGRADLDASEQLQLTNELILFLRDAAQP